MKFKKDDVIIIGFYFPKICFSEEWKNMLKDKGEWIDDAFVYKNEEFHKSGLTYEQYYNEHKPEWTPVYCKII